MATVTTMIKAAVNTRRHSFLMAIAAIPVP
jgi:hypothetical protein